MSLDVEGEQRDHFVLHISARGLEIGPGIGLNFGIMIGQRPHLCMYLCAVLRVMRGLKG